jgi:hypothetical protein
MIMTTHSSYVVNADTHSRTWDDLQSSGIRTAENGCVPRPVRLCDTSLDHLCGAFVCSHIV